MTYEQTIDYLFHAAPLFQNIGAGAYKEGLANTLALDEHFGHPHRSYKTIHVAGTNDKGSVSSTLAAILQSAGYRVGLYTSPHMEDFRERIRVNGQLIPKERVVRFVAEERSFFEPLHPSFFELTTALAFKYFAEAGVDVAVVEVGLGGRMDCTNIITPLVSIITNISFDHTQFLGNTLAEIAAEKAGIIKPGVPVVVGEAPDPEVHRVFLSKAAQMAAPIRFADQEQWPSVAGQLQGSYQQKNAATIQCAVDVLRHQAGSDLQLSPQAVAQGFAHVCELTGLSGRWQQLGSAPTVVCDAGHNVGGIRYVARQLQEQPCDTLRVVFGMVGDKDVRGVLSLMPQAATYYFTQPSCARALPAEQLAAIAAELGLKGRVVPSVAEAYHEALNDASAADFIFVGGSCYVVADLLATIHGEDKKV